MDNTPRKIYLFTDRYPYGRGETFVAPELGSQAADTVHITVIPARHDSVQRPLPEGIRLCTYLSQAPARRKVAALARTLFSTHLWCLPFCSRRPKNTKQWRNAFGGLYRAYLTLFTVKAHRDFFHRADIFYSYWLDNTATGLALVKAHLKGFENKPLVCRAHGYDVFEQQRGVFFPDRPFALERMEKVFPVSIPGTELLQTVYAKRRSLFECRHLGVDDRPCTPHALAPGHLRFVSCANVIALKRVGLVADFLKRYAGEHPGMKISWTHFGAGPFLESVKNEARRDLPPNLEAIFEGPVPNADVMQCYEKGEFDIFVSLSQSEGMPVSVIEAMSCGIVPLCTDAGGTLDAVDSEVGLLLPLNPSYDDFAQGIRHILDHYESLGRQAQDRQRAHFSAERNFSDFYRYLSSLVG